MTAVEDIRTIAARLAGTDLRPGPLVNGLFQSLVAAALAAAPHELLDARTIEALHRLCSRGEANLEAHWASRIHANPESIVDFPYLDNYRKLAAAEYRAIVDALGAAPRTLVFVGSGPLPLSAVLLAQSGHGLRVTCVDRDVHAVRQGWRVARALIGPGARAALTFARADAGKHDYSAYDVVLVAALVGLTRTEKATMLGRIADTLAPGSLLAARSVPEDGRRMLYPRIEHSSVPATLDVLGEVDPPPGVINSLLLMRPARS